MCFLLLFLVQPLPLATLDGLVGTWSFEWNVPDSPLGTGGKIEGTERCTRVSAPPTLAAVRGFPNLSPAALPPITGDRLVYDCLTDATGPDGRIRIRAVIALDPTAKTLTRVEADSRGFQVTKTGTVGGDLGGYTSVFWTSAPLTVKGQTIELSGRTIMYSPVSMRVENRISINGGAPMDFGRPWYKKIDTPGK
jgi:hypothetical protein